MKKLSQKLFVAKANKIHKNKYDYSKAQYRGGLIKINIICPIHGRFRQKAGNHIHLKRGCPKCSTGVKLSKKEFLIKCKLKHGNKYDYSNVIFTGVKNKITIICPIHGEFLQTAEKHFIYGCGLCAKNKQVPIDELINKYKKINNNKYEYPRLNYTRAQSKINVSCKIHGEFSVYHWQHIKGVGCKKCDNTERSSKKERLWLDILGIGDEHRLKQIVIKNKRYIPDAIVGNIIYEFLGDFFHGHPKTFKKNNLNKLTGIKFGRLFNKTRKRIRTFRKQGYKVFSIWERDFDRKIKNGEEFKKGRLSKNISNSRVSEQG